jgi:uncharacterized protein (DUF1015 family)
MADIRPFRAWRYNPRLIPDLRRVVAPLFDVVSNEQRDGLLNEPLNAIHLSNPPSVETAIGSLHHLIEHHLLVQDKLPAIYPYYMYFSLYGEAQQFCRKGFVALVKITPEGDSGDIIPHEETLPGSVSSMTELYQGLQMQLAPTHGLYYDPDFVLESLMDPYLQYPLVSIVDYQRVVNQLSAIQHAEQIRVFMHHFADKSIWLADGHHRLESSRSYLRRKLAENPDLPEKHPARYHLMYLSNTASDDLRILPTHRVVKLPVGYTPLQLLTGLSRWYDIQPMDSRSPYFQLLRQGRCRMGLLLPDGAWLLDLKPELDPVDLIQAPMSAALKRLSYTLLHVLVFEELLGMPYAEQTSNGQIRFVKDFTATAEAAQDADTAAFVLPEISFEQMMDVCNAGEKMPPKSTFFYPKMLTGLTFSSYLDDYRTTPFDSGF